jgi:hypothetical protein
MWSEEEIQAMAPEAHTDLKARMIRIHQRPKIDFTTLDGRRFLVAVEPIPRVVEILPSL